MNKTKKFALLVASAVFVITAVSCATTKGTQEPQKTQKKEKTITYELIDWDGAVAGKDLAEWPYNLQDDGLEALEDYPGIKEKVENNKYFITYGENTNKKLAREEARNALSFQLAQQLNTRAIATFNQVIDDKEQAQETINATASKAQFTGFERVAETWVFRLKTDKRKDKTTEEYTYYELFVCDRDVFKQQVDKYLSEIAGKVVKPENMQKANELRDELVNEFANNDKATLQEIEQ